MVFYHDGLVLVDKGGGELCGDQTPILFLGGRSLQAARVPMAEASSFPGSDTETTPASGGSSRSGQSAFARSSLQ